ncbi:MAG: cobalamin biosynthesis protein [Spongiibacteraceae bacterium]|jgi:adenosylcobinamide-phosphate synthase|nr:cobalamin biosynthesis protein [Spongiibacteraceae bacterium]
MYLWLSLVISLLVNRWLGEPRAGHPVVLYRRLARRVEVALSRGVADDPGGRALLLGRGAVALILMVLPAVALASMVQLWLWWWSPLLFVGGAALILALAIARNTLMRYAHYIAGRLAEGDLPGARRELARILSRDCEALSEEEVSRALVEAILRNGNDNLLASVFWFVLGGLPGVAMHRAVHILNGCWDNDDFSWATRRCETLLNWVPARLTAISYAAAGRLRPALRCWQRQSGNWSYRQAEARNATPLLAAGGGALGIVLGGPIRRDGLVIERPLFGDGRAPCPTDVERALTLINRGLALWLLLLLVAAAWPAAT